MPDEPVVLASIYPALFRQRDFSALWWGQLVSLVGEELPPVRRELLASYEEGIACYRERRFMDASQSFERALAINPDDLPSRTYYERCNFMVVSPPPDDWDGVWALSEK